MCVASTDEIMNLWFETRMQSIMEFKTKYPIFKPMNASCEVQELGINKYVVYSAGQGIMTVSSKIVNIVQDVPCALSGTRFLKFMVLTL